MNFIEKLLTISRKSNSLVCVGLDVDLDRIPKFLLREDDPIFVFNRAIVDATQDLVCAYKPNIAFYEALGVEGLVALKKTIEHIPSDIPVILDAKRGDIGYTAKMYARTCFEHYGCDAVTVNPYLGEDSIEPFLGYKDKCVFVLCLTSNQGAKDFQYFSNGNFPLYRLVAEKVKGWNKGRNCGLIVGAIRPEQLGEVRQVAPDLPFLIPGVGVQGGDVELAVRFGTNEHGELAIISSSRGIIYASSGRDFAGAARQATVRLRDEVNRWR